MFAARGIRAARTAGVAGVSSGVRAAVTPARSYSPTATLSTPTTPATPVDSAIAPPAFSLAGKLVLLTGAARGLGLVMGQAIVASGANLAVVDLNKEEAETQAKLMVEAFKTRYPDKKSPTVTAHYADVADEDSVTNCIAEVTAKHSELTGAPATINGLVTSAGFCENTPAVDYPTKRLRALWAVNVDGTYLFATAVARHLAERGNPAASMVLVGSMSGAVVNVPQPQAPYNASKAAVRQLAASLAVEWAPAGIRVNCLSPGYMETALTSAILAKEPALRERWTAGVPSGRLGVPRDLAGPVVFLLSDAAAYVTGADLRVDGGYTII